MKNVVLRGVLAVVIGLVIGGFVNSSIVKISPDVFGVPDGVDIMDVHSIKANLHRYSSTHFIGPLLAHGLGTLVGAFLTAKIALKSKMTLGMVIGGFFLLGGITMVVMLPEQPIWVMVVDLVLAYFPMSYLGVKLAK